MSSYLVQAGTSLYLQPRAGGTATQVTLPSTITLYGPSQPCRAALFLVGVTPIIIVVNGGTHDFWIDQFGVARQLQISSPIAAPLASSGTGSGLTGVYACAATYKVKDTNGATIFETGLGPISTGATLSGASGAGQTLRIDSVPVSGDAVVNARGLYRTLAGGNTLYPWFDIDNNSDLFSDRGGADSTLSLLPTSASMYGAPPDLKLITSWKSILWGVPRIKFDLLQWTEPSVFYAWAQSNSVPIPPQATDNFGVTAFIPRRDQLGIARWDRLHQITGDSDDSFSRAQVSPNIGCVSQESVVVIRDVGYWLGERGVAEWTAQSIGYVTEAQVNPWFTTDTYLNRAMFPFAQGRYNHDLDAYELLVATAGSSVLNAWITFDIKARAWYGLHTSRLPVTICASDTERRGFLRDTNNLPIAVFGTSDGRLERRDPTVADDDGQKVDLDVITPVFGGSAHEQEKVWAVPTLHSRVEPLTPNNAGVQPDVLTVTSSVGPIGPSGTVSGSDVVTSADLTTGFQRLQRPGSGQYASFRFQHSAHGESVRLYGLEVPYGDIGKRAR